MKEILLKVIFLMVIANVSAIENEEIKRSGFYLGVGANVNYDNAEFYNKDALQLQTGGIIQANSKIAKAIDLSCGIHALLGYGHIFSNYVYLGIEEQIGVASHPCNGKRYITNEAFDSKIVKPWEFTTLAKIGYVFESFPGIAYVSAGMKILRIDINDDDIKNICNPVFGVGYQHVLSQHWSIRGDALYTHVNNVDLKQKIQSGYYLKMKAKGHRISAMVTLVYTF